MFVKQLFRRGDTIYDTIYRHKFFMPVGLRYRRVGLQSRSGSIEGSYYSHKANFHQYQSVLRNCRVILIEKDLTKTITQSKFIYQPHMNSLSYKNGKPF